MLSEAKESSNDDRLHYLFLNLIGQVVTVYMEDGTVLEGLFISVDDNKENMLLSKSRFCTSLQHSSDDEALVKDKLIIKMDGIVMVDVNDAAFRGAGPNRGVNDPLRSGGAQVMQRWADIGDEEGEDLEAGGKDGKDWDQFEENKKRFGTKSTWDENLYTTKLDTNQFTAEQKSRAARLAREIETGTAHGGVQHRIERGEDLGEDDATLFSDVQGDRTRPEPKKFGGGGGGAYVPPGKRPAGQAGPPAAVGDLDERAQRMAGTQPGKRTDPADAAPPALGASGPDAGPGAKTGFNAAAKEWKPSVGPASPEETPIISNMLEEMAKALQKSGLAKSCSPDWPGDDLYYDEEQNDGMGGMGGGMGAGMGNMGGGMGMGGNGGPGMGAGMGGGMGGPGRGGNFGPQGGMQGGGMGGGPGMSGPGGNFGGGNMGGPGMGGPSGNMGGGHGGPGGNYGGGNPNMGGHGGPGGNFGGHGGPGPSGPGGNFGGGGNNYGGGGNMGGGHGMGGPGGNYGGNQGGHHPGGPSGGPGGYGGNQGGNFPAHGGGNMGGGMDRGPNQFGNHPGQHMGGGGPGPSGYGRDQGGNMGGPQQGMGRGGPQHMDPNGPGPSGFGGPGPQGGPQGGPSGGMQGRGGMPGRGGGGRGMGNQPHQPLPSMGGQGGPSAPSAIDTPQQGGDRAGGAMRGRGGGPMQGRGGGAGGNDGPRGPPGSQLERGGKGKR